MEEGIGLLLLRLPIGLNPGSGIGNKKFEDETSVVRSDSNGALDVGDVFSVDPARPNPASINGHGAGISSIGFCDRRTQAMCLLGCGCNAKRFQGEPAQLEVATG